MLRVAITVLVTVAIASGCTTKRYGRPGKVTDAEKAVYDCRDIDLELAKVAEFRSNMAQESQLDARSIGAFLMDFGIGNHMERNDADRAVSEREAGLIGLRAARGC